MSRYIARRIPILPLSVSNIFQISDQLIIQATHLKDSVPALPIYHDLATTVPMINPSSNKRHVRQCVTGDHFIARVAVDDNLSFASARRCDDRREWIDATHWRRHQDRLKWPIRRFEQPPPTPPPQHSSRFRKSRLAQTEPFIRSKIGHYQIPFYVIGPYQPNLCLLITGKESGWNTA